jgi:hypothetical protein
VVSLISLSCVEIVVNELSSVFAISVTFWIVGSGVFDIVFLAAHLGSSLDSSYIAERNRMQSYIC